MARSKKTAGTALDRRNGQRMAIGGGYVVERFDPPDVLCEEAHAAWEQYWEDRQAQLLTPSGKVILLRWIDALNRYLVTLREADRSPLVSGSQGQQVLNPLYKIAADAKSTVEACERQLGIGGLNSHSLGIAAITEQRSLQEMNARYVDTDDDDEDDPRLRLVAGSVE